MVNILTYNVQSHYVINALYFFLQRTLGTLYLVGLLDQKSEKNCNNDKLKFKKSRIAATLCQPIFLLMIATVGQAKVFCHSYIVLRKQVRVHFVPHSRIAPTFSYMADTTMQCTYALSDAFFLHYILINGFNNTSTKSFQQTFPPSCSCKLKYLSFFTCNLVDEHKPK